MAMKQRSSQKFLSTIYDAKYRIYDCQQHVMPTLVFTKPSVIYLA